MKVVGLMTLAFLNFFSTVVVYFIIGDLIFRYSKVHAIFIFGLLLVKHVSGTILQEMVKRQGELE